MNKAQLIEMLGMRLGMEKKMAAQAVDAMFDIIVRNVDKGENVTLTGFGVFEKRARAARTARKQVGVTAQLGERAERAVGGNGRDIGEHQREHRHIRRHRSRLWAIRCPARATRGMRRDHCSHSSKPGRSSSAPAPRAKT